MSSNPSLIAGWSLGLKTGGQDEIDQSCVGYSVATPLSTGGSQAKCPRNPSQSKLASVSPFGEIVGLRERFRPKLPVG